MDIRAKIAKIFREAREKQQLTQLEAAKKAKVNSNYYARIERVDPMPRIDIVDRIAKALGVKIKLPMD